MFYTFVFDFASGLFCQFLKTFDHECHYTHACMQRVKREDQLHA